MAERKRKRALEAWSAEANVQRRPLALPLCKRMKPIFTRLPDPIASVDAPRRAASPKMPAELKCGICKRIQYLRMKMPPEEGPLAACEGCNQAMCAVCTRECGLCGKTLCGGCAIDQGEEVHCKKC